MADNTTLDAGSGGDTIAADDISSVKYQRIKLIHGADGVNAGDVALANGLPVQPATSAAFPVTDNDSTLSIDDGDGSITVDGTVTVTATNLSANVAQYGGSAVGATNAVHVQAGTGATFPITDNSGSITVDNGGTFAVQAAQSGTWNVATLTSITNVVHVDDNSLTLSVDDGDGSLTIDGTVAISGTVTVGSHAVTNAGTFAVQVDGAALTALQLIDDVVFAEDAAHVSGDKGVMALAVRRDANTTLADTTGDYAPLQVDATGSLKVAIISGAGSGGTASTDQGTFTASTTSGTPAMGAYDDTGPSTMTEDKLGILRMTAYRGLHVNLRDASGAEVSVGGGTQYDEDAAHVSGSKVTGCGIVRKDTPTSLCGTDGDYTMPIADANGRLYVACDTHAVTQSGTWNVGTVTTVTTVSTITNVVHVDDNSGSLTIDNAALSVTGGGVEASALRVTIASDSTGVLSVDDNGGSLTVDGTVTVTQSTASSLNVQAVGEVAHDGADSGNPLKVGAKASTSLSGLTTVANADRTNLHAGVDGVLITRPHSNLEDIVSGVAAITDGSSTSVISAQGAGIKTYITAVIIANSSAANVTVDLRDGTAGSVKATFPAPANGGVVLQLDVPLAFSANTAVAADPSASATTVTVTLLGFKSKI